MKGLKLAAIASLLTFFTPVAGAQASPAYDGRWRVHLVTSAGSCERSYIYSVAIQNGAVAVLPSAGAPDAVVDGAVLADGKLALTLHSSMAVAHASGHLRGTGGAGSWRLDLLG